MSGRKVTATYTYEVTAPFQATSYGELEKVRSVRPKKMMLGEKALEAILSSEEGQRRLDERPGEFEAAVRILWPLPDHVKAAGSIRSLPRCHLGPLPLLSLVCGNPPIHPNPTPLGAWTRRAQPLAWNAAGASNESVFQIAAIQAPGHRHPGMAGTFKGATQRFVDRQSLATAAEHLFLLIIGLDR
jgi:hypothetical protein